MLTELDDQKGRGMASIKNTGSTCLQTNLLLKNKAVIHGEKRYKYIAAYLSRDLMYQRIYCSISQMRFYYIKKPIRYEMQHSF